MIPSRGLRWSSQAIGIGRRGLEPFSSRHFSSSVVQHTAFRPNPLLLKNGVSTSRAHSRSQISKTNNIIRNGVTVRFASSAPLVAPVSKTPTPTEAIPSSAVPSPEIVPSSLQDATDFTVDSLYNIPESIGYLKSLGLDYGWGPTAVMEWALEHVHIYAGTPWWISIILTTALVRVVLFKAYMMASDNGAKMAVVRPLTEPLTKEMSKAQQAGNSEKVWEIRREIQTINKRAGVKIWKSLVPMVQVFTGYGIWKCLRGMSNLPVPGLESGGILWFHNLTVADPYFVLPALTSLVLHWVLRKGGETGSSTMSARATKIMMIAFPALSFLFTFWLPASVQLSFMAAGILSYLQMEIFRNEGFRQWAGMYPLQAPAPSGGPPSTPYKGIINVKARPAALTQEQLNKTYSEPSPQFKAGQQSLNSLKPPGVIAGAFKGIKTTFTQAKEGMSETAKSAKEMMGDRKQKGDREARARYELKRQEELAAERQELERRKSAERRARKAARRS